MSAGLGREIRNFSAVPLILIDSTGVEREVIKALDSGADDCMSKLVRPQEFLAGIIALLRRSQKLPLVSRREPFVSGKLFIDLDNDEVRIVGNPVKLTLTEFEILRCLVNNASRSMSHSQLAHLIKGDDGQWSRNNLNVRIQHLRTKLGDTGREPQYILSERAWDTISPPAGVYTSNMLEPAKPAMILRGFHLSADIAVGWYTLSTLPYACGKETSQTI